MRPADHRPARRVRGRSLFAALPSPRKSPPRGWAFKQGRLGRMATPRPAAPSAAARRSPPFRTTPPIPGGELLRQPGLGTQACGASQCLRERTPAADPSCTAVQFSQTVPPTARLPASRRPTPCSRAVAHHSHRRPAGHRRKHRRHLQRLRRPDRHHARTVSRRRSATSTARWRPSPDKVLIVTPIQTPGCSAGQFLTRVTADPARPASTTWPSTSAAGPTASPRCTSFTIDKSSGRVYMDLGSQDVPGSLNTQIPPDPRAPRGSTASSATRPTTASELRRPQLHHRAWFYNPARARATTAPAPSPCRPPVSFSDTWDNRCATLGAVAMIRSRLDRRRLRRSPAQSAPSIRRRLPDQNRGTCVEGPGDPQPSAVPGLPGLLAHPSPIRCVSQTMTDDCQPLRDRGCSQIGSRCMDTNPQGACMLYEQTWQCRVAVGTTSTITNCGGQQFCLDGRCFDAGTRRSPTSRVRCRTGGAARSRSLPGPEHAGGVQRATTTAAARSSSAW